jgi:predicted transposase YdaD
MAMEHDRFVKAVFGHPTQAAGHLSRFLAPEVARCLDLGRMTRVPGSFVDPKLAERHTDLLFSVPLVAADEPERQALVYVLFEHQSTVDPLMAWRLLSCMVRVWSDWVGRHPQPTRLPAILPLVLYHGQERWTAATNVAHLFDLDTASLAALGPHLPSFEMVLNDLGREPDERLAIGGLDALARLLLKHITARDLADRLLTWAEVLRSALDDAGLSRFEVVVEYVLPASEHVPVEALRQVLDQAVDEEAGDVVMSVAERLLQQGREEGREEGQLLGAQRTLIRQFERRFGEPDAATQRRIAQANQVQLDIWTGKILDAATPEELFAGE